MTKEQEKYLKQFDNLLSDYAKFKELDRNSFQMKTVENYLLIILDKKLLRRNNTDEILVALAGTIGIIYSHFLFDITEVSKLEIAKEAEIFHSATWVSYMPKEKIPKWKIWKKESERCRFRIKENLYILIDKFFPQIATEV